MEPLSQYKSRQKWCGVPYPIIGQISLTQSTTHYDIKKSIVITIGAQKGAGKLDLHSRYFGAPQQKD